MSYNSYKTTISVELNELYNGSRRRIIQATPVQYDGTESQETHFINRYVQIRKGMRHGHKIICRGSRTNPELTVILNLADHPIFERRGIDLHITMQLGLAESLCGIDKEIVTLDDRILVISSPPTKIIEHNEQMTIMGEGMPIYLNSTRRGNLIIKFAVNLPSDRVTRQPVEYEQNDTDYQ